MASTTNSQVTLTEEPQTTSDLSFWQRRSRLERRLLTVTTLCLFVAVGLAVAVALLVPQLQEGNAEPAASTTSTKTGRQGRKTNFSAEAKEYKRDICNTPGCVLAASDLLKNMDDSVDPCEDFYSFACGGFEKKTIIPDDKSRMTVFTMLGDKVVDQLKIAIDQPVKGDEVLPFRLVKNLYQSCVNKGRIEELGLEPLKEILKKLGGWPVVEGDNWDSTTFVWYELIYKLRKIGYSVDYIVDFSVFPDQKNSTFRTIELDQPSIGMPSRDYILKGLQDKDVKAYLDYQTGLATLLGADKERARAELTEALLFETQIAKISQPREQRRDANKLYNPMTIKELSERIPSIPWLDYMNTLLAPFFNLTLDERIIVATPKVLEDLAKLLESTPKRVQANYLLWRVAGATVSYSSEEARSLQLKYASVVTGITERKPRWKECVEIVSGSLGHAVGAMYVRSYFKEEAKKAVLEIVSDVRSAFNDIVDNIDWMDPETKQRAREKAAAMAAHVGYPEELLDDQKLTDLYANLDLDPTNYLGNGANLSIFGTDYAFRRLREPVNKSDWISNGRPATVNAFYATLENSIKFPAGILQGAFFGKDRPSYINYAAVGWIIGHEITHGFDDLGRQFGPDGNLNNWWLPDTMQKYGTKAQCMTQQYGNYTLPHLNLTVNGAATLGETIADNGGIKEAYLAYQKWIDRQKKGNGDWDQVESRLPGFGKYSTRQMFWIGAANIWCSKFKPEAMKLRVRTAPHPPPQYRVIGAFSNMPQFAEDFKCPLGKPMNPPSKCSVW